MNIQCNFCGETVDMAAIKQVILKRPNHKSLFTLWQCNKCKDKEKIAIPKIGTLIVVKGMTGK